MESGLDAEKVGRSILETRSGVECPPQDGRAGGHVCKLAAYAHDFPGVGDPTEIMTARCDPAARALRRNHQGGGARFEARAQDQGAVASKRGIDKIFGE